MKKILSLLLFLATVITSVGQDLVIRAGHLIDPATGTVTQNQVILIRGGKIVEIGPAGAVPSGVPLVDLSQDWVLPGLMDAHTHITMGVPPAPGPVSAWESYLLHESTATRALRGLHNAKAVLEAGFTTVRDVGNDGDYADTAIREAFEKEWFIGPTLLNAGKIISPFGGQFGGGAPEMGTYWRHEYIDADTPDEVRKAVRQNIYYGAKLIKLASDSQSYHFSLEEIRAAADETHKAGLTLAVHTLGGEAARNAILGGADSVEHGYELTDELLQLMKEKGTFLAGTDFPYEHRILMSFLPNPRERAQQIIDRLRRAHRIGVKLAFSTDVVLDVPGRTRADLMLDYLKVWQDAGVPAADTLRAMTTDCAALFHIQEQRGAIRVGQAADIIGTPRNPMQDIQALRAVNFVAKDGRVIRKP